MPQSTTISFVTWPDGKVDENSLTVCGNSKAKERFVAGWLPNIWFGSKSIEYVIHSLWEGAREKGFRCYTIEIGADGEAKVQK